MTRNTNPDCFFVGAARWTAHAFAPFHVEQWRVARALSATVASGVIERSSDGAFLQSLRPIALTLLLECLKVPIEIDILGVGVGEVGLSVRHAVSYLHVEAMSPEAVLALHGLKVEVLGQLAPNALYSIEEPFVSGAHSVQSVESRHRSNKITISQQVVV